MANAIPASIDPSADRPILPAENTLPSDPIDRTPPAPASADVLLQEPSDRVGPVKWAQLVEQYGPNARFRLPGGSYINGKDGAIREDK